MYKLGIHLHAYVWILWAVHAIYNKLVWQLGNLQLYDCVDSCVRFGFNSFRHCVRRAYFRLLIKSQHTSRLLCFDAVAMCGPVRMTPAASVASLNRYRAISVLFHLISTHFKIFNIVECECEHFEHTRIRMPFIYSSFDSRFRSNKK